MSVRPGDGRRHEDGASASADFHANRKGRRAAGRRSGPPVRAPRHRPRARGKESVAQHGIAPAAAGRGAQIAAARGRLPGGETHPGAARRNRPRRRVAPLVRRVCRPRAPAPGPRRRRAQRHPALCLRCEARCSPDRAARAAGAAGRIGLLLPWRSGRARVARLHRIRSRRRTGGRDPGDSRTQGSDGDPRRRRSREPGACASAPRRRTPPRPASGVRALDRDPHGRGRPPLALLPSPEVTTRAMSKARILIVDDEESTRELFAELLQRWGYEVDRTADGHAALKIAAEMHPDVIISDLVMPKLDGLALVRALREEQPDTPVVIITGKGTIDTAVEAVREGVFDFLEKPIDPPRLKVILQRALEKKQTLHEMLVLRRRIGDMEAGVGLVGNSPPMRRAMELVEKVAPSKASVVITGQSGTGKEMVARAIHQLSPRRDKPFIAINCSAIPATLMESELFGHERGAFTGADQRRLGAWELADSGTLFLDEIAEVPIELQAKFLRVLEEERLRRLGGKSEITVDVRVISATNKDLKEEIKAQRFREDLYFRLNVFHINLAPLRERREDIPVLVQHFIDKFGKEGGKKLAGVTPQAMKVLCEYGWPGNIRELRNTLERAVILCGGGIIDVEHLPAELAVGGGESAYLKLPFGLPLREVEKEYILSSLGRMQNNKARTAQALGISEKTLYNKLYRYSGKAGRSKEQYEDEDDGEGGSPDHPPIPKATGIA